MDAMIIVMVAIFAVIVIIGIFALIVGRKKAEEIRKTGKYPEGHFIGQWMGIGIALGIPIGLAMDNISIGPAIGICIGLAIGSAVEAKYKKEGKIRALTKQEEKTKKKALFIGLILLVLGVLAGLGFFFLR